MHQPPQPKTAFFLGVVLAATGAVLQLVLPALGYSIAEASSTALGMDQDILLGFDFAVRAIGLIVTPLGTVLIGAGLVMAHCNRIAATAVARAASPSGETGDIAHAPDDLL